MKVKWPIKSIQKVCSTLLIIKEIKTKMRHHYRLVGQLKCKLLIIPSVKDDGSKWNLYTADGSVRIVLTSLKN